jgi:glycosyltransferase involved in cell wall biosynthesis
VFSVVILTYNEEVNIARALESVAFSDDVIVIDSFSVDETKAICEQFENVRFIQNPFENLASQRQFALDQRLPRHKWVLALDADEWITPALRDELLDISSTWSADEPVAYDLAMRIYMWGKWLRYSSEYPVYWRRFFRHEFVTYQQRGHADTLDVTGPVGRTQNDIIHEDRKGLSDWLSKHNQYTTQEATYVLEELPKVPYSDLLSRDRLLRRRALKRFFRSLPGNSFLRFAYLYVFRRGFLDGWAGYSFCRLVAHQSFIVRLKQKEILLAEKSEKLA